MNYAVCVAVGIGLFSGGWWWAGARRTYTGPRTKDLMHVVPSSPDSAVDAGIGSGFRDEGDGEGYNRV